jgi:anti-sigma factor RsiW
VNDVVCASGVDLLMDYLEGELPAEVRAALDAHVAGCPRCVAFIASYRATPSILRRSTAAALPEALGDSLLAVLRARRGAPPDPSGA